MARRLKASRWRNLFHVGELPKMRVLEEVRAAGRRCALAHAKLRCDGALGTRPPAPGSDYDLYMVLLRGAGYRGPLIPHALAEAQVDRAAFAGRRAARRCAGTLARGQGDLGIAAPGPISRPGPR